MDVVKFYGVLDEFGQFSNFAPFSITGDGERWPTPEHYFQAQKFGGTAYEPVVHLPGLDLLAVHLNAIGHREDALR